MIFIARSGCRDFSFTSTMRSTTSSTTPLTSRSGKYTLTSSARLGLIQTLLYAGVTPGTAVPGFHDITSGNNGAYAAGPGWDACSGLGSPDGTALLTRLQA